MILILVLLLIGAGLFLRLAVSLTWIHKPVSVWEIFLETIKAQRK